MRQSSGSSRLCCCFMHQWMRVGPCQMTEIPSPHMSIPCVALYIIYIFCCIIHHCVVEQLYIYGCQASSHLHILHLFHCTPFVFLINYPFLLLKVFNTLIFLLLITGIFQSQDNLNVPVKFQYIMVYVISTQYNSLVFKCW